MEPLFAPMMAGFALGGGLIVAIGAQNAFVLRLGLLRQHVFAVCLVCAASDAFLILLGVAGLGTLIQQSQTLLTVTRLGGAAFLSAYGFLAFRRALQPKALAGGKAQNLSLKTALLTTLAFTYLNPHVYLDTVVLLGSFSAQYQAEAKFGFTFGAVLASFTWFYALGYGARALSPILAAPGAWRGLDVLIGAIMWVLAISLLF